MARELTRGQIEDEAHERFEAASEMNRAVRRERDRKVADKAAWLRDFYTQEGVTKAELLGRLDGEGKATEKRDVLIAKLALKEAEMHIAPAEEPNDWVWLRWTCEMAIADAEKYRLALKEAVAKGEEYRWAVKTARKAELARLIAECWFDVLYLWIEHEEEPTFPQAVEYRLHYGLKHSGGFSTFGDDEGLGAEAFLTFSREASRVLAQTWERTK